MGKSLLMLDFALACSGNGRLLGCFDIEPIDVLYFCLEDNQQRIKERIKKMQPDCEAPKRINFVFNLTGNPTTELSDALDVNSNIKVVIIDTLEIFQRSISGSGYSKQYQFLSKLKNLADKHNILIMVVHHTRKTKSDDVFDMLYGSKAISGAADLMWNLKRERNNSFGELAVTGRDVPERTLHLNLNDELLNWILIDPATRKLFKDEIQKVYEVLYNYGQPMKLHDLWLATEYKKPVLSKYLKSLIDCGYVERLGLGLYIAKHAPNNQPLIAF